MVLNNNKKMELGKMVPVIYSNWFILQISFTEGA